MGSGNEGQRGRDAALDDPTLLANDLRRGGVLYGITTPRLFTPPRCELTPANTLGYEAIEFARDVLGIDLYPWQEWLLIHALELNPDGTFRFRKVVVLVARQQGKTTLFKVWALWRLFCDAAEAVMGTAQDLPTAEKTWEQTYNLAKSIPELATELGKDSFTNGAKFFRLKTGGEYLVKAATAGGGRGASVELVFMDELREHKDHKSYSAVTKTTNAIPRAQVVMMSNAGDATSVVLNDLQDAARAKILTGDTDSSQTGLFEWSAEDGCNVWDRRGWAQACPSTGYGITEQIIAGDCEADPEAVFRTEVLCQRVQQLERSIFTLEDGVDTWAKSAVRVDEHTGEFECVLPESGLDAAIELSHNRGTAYIVAAGMCECGRVVTEVVAQRGGTDWIIPWLKDPDRAGLFGRLTVQGKGSPASSLVDSLVELNAEKVEADYEAGRDPRPYFEFVEWGGSELAKAHGAFFDLVTGQPGEKFVHMNQPVANAAADTAKPKPLGSAFVFDLAKSPNDVAPLIAMVAAVWLLSRASEASGTSAYDDDDAELIVLE
ncbi:terminase large subunit [Gordonia phage Catfish]|uniref:Terminase large subunit n=1 Tax=Gordonia phage Catfish TaxID=2301538 RepID=A0A385D0H1_9CAUD|nr:terminase large subunit [Gordonia phage Catfish]AXQ51843.1 terminase large subunit [Gordonia phage Catfish]